MNIVLFILFILFGIFFLFILLGFIRTWQIQHSAEHKKFLQGKIPYPLPDGFYKGRAKSYVGPWVGKSFHREKSTGMNVFAVGKTRIEQFPFKTYIAKGLQDKNIDVLKIDYNLSQNSFFLKMVLDEIVETEKGTYIGKIHIKCIPQFPFSVGFFYLEK